MSDPALEAALWEWRGLLLRRYPIVRSPGHYWHVVLARHRRA